MDRLILFSIHPDALLKDNVKTDLIIIPSIRPASIEKNLGFIPWITSQYKQGAEVASLCVGAFLLAATGLLDSRTCSTHWIAADAFRQMFPQVRLAAERVITDEQGLYTSGGAYSFLNLILYLVEKQTGRDTAVYLAKLMEIEIDRYSQSPFSIFRPTWKAM